jgi:capsular exopolysaccharide synthesis family protein
MENNQQLTTPAVNLLAPADRFASASKLYGGLHRWRLLLGRYGWIPVLLVPLVLAAVWYVTSHLPPVYESKARLWLPGKLDIHEGRLYTEELIDYLGTQAELLRSPAIQQRALARLGGSSTPDAAAITTNGGAKSEFPFKVKVVDARKSSLLELRVGGAEPDSTRAFLTYLMEEYLRFKREARANASERTVTSVTAQLKELAGELRVQQEKLHAFQSSNNVVFLQEQGNSAGSYLAMLNRRLANLQTELGLIRSLLPEQWIETKTSREHAPPDEALTDTTASKEVLASLAGPQLELFKANQQMQLLKAKRDELSRFLRPLHPKIIKLNEDILTQEKLAQISRDEAVKQMTHRRQAIELEIKNLQAAFEEWDAKAIAASRKMADYDRLRQDLQRIQSAYDKMVALIQTVDVGRTVEQENVAILDPASPATPSNRMVKYLALAFAGALALAFGLLYCLGIFHDDFASLTELGEHLSEEVVGQVPAIAIKKPKRGLGLEVLEKQRFEFLESFRNIRSALLFMGNGGAKPKTIIIASSVPDEGKSTVALYLAATMALGNSRVLLVDADMRRGTLHEFFGLAPSPGLAEILNRETSAARAIVHPELNNLAFLPAGQAKRNPGELVLSSEWSCFLEEVRQQFDYVLVDTPPVLATNDVAGLASKADAVLFVVRASYTSARMARGALGVLRQRHAKVLGLIFNRAVSSPYEQPHYQRYRRAYGWKPKKTRGAPAPAGNPISNANDGQVQLPTKSR